MSKQQQHLARYKLVVLAVLGVFWTVTTVAQTGGRQKILLNTGWLFFKGDPPAAKGLSYDTRPVVADKNDNIVADSKPTERLASASSDSTLKKWILPSANEFISNPVKKHLRPAGSPALNISFAQAGFNDAEWQKIIIPHDWAINDSFYTTAHAVVGGGMGRLPVQGVGWYRKKLHIPLSDKGKEIYLEVDGAMSYAMVWLNGHLLGGWPYGYNSFRIQLTPYLVPGGDNQLAIRLDNPANSSRWYPGAGLYRNVWLTKVNPVHIAHWGTFITATNVSAAAATLNLSVAVENKTAINQSVKIETTVYRAHNGKPLTTGKAATFAATLLQLSPGQKLAANSTVNINKPALWGPPPAQQPNLYIAITRLYIKGKLVDTYQTNFGIREVQFDAVKGLLVNKQPVRIQGVNQHHDLGALGAAFNTRAAQRQLELLQELGCNAIRMAHNPPAPELLALTDQMGFLVIDEIFDSWERKKTALDFHLLFADWAEADTRAFIRRDRNHPSVIAWSFGNEVGEQYTDTAGAAIAAGLYAIVKEEDSTRPATASMNYAKPSMPFANVMDIISLNYQGEGIRDAPGYAHLNGIRTAPLYPAFHQKFPNKMIVSSETASALSSRGSYIFPVTSNSSAPVSDSTGGDSVNHYVSAYELYTAAFGASPDKVFASQDKHPFVAGEFVWSGWDYLGEPTPYYSARSSYCGIIDLAGFKKDRFYLYQSRWRPNLRMVHILPHWNWPGRIGLITPVHIFTSGDAAELFLNGRSLGKKQKQPFEYRLRWDDVSYEPGELKVVSYKNGKIWAEQTVHTTDTAAQLYLTADRTPIQADGKDLCFVTIRVADKNGLTVPVANNSIRVTVAGVGELVATDNGNPADMVSFGSHKRDAYFGLALAIIRSKVGKAGVIKVTVESPGLSPAVLELYSK
ncbi:MAG: hypothetical protein RL172_2726 [Bacteroidota bacterium]|jgi:beta-galactosidase